MTALSAQGYLQSVEGQLVADGCTVHTEDWQGTSVLVGHRADFRLRWIATKLHLVTVAAVVPGVTVATIAGFTTQAITYAKQGKWLGMQSGVAVFPTLISEYVDPEALSWAADRQRVEFARMARPVVVDTTRGLVGAFRGNAVMGRLYSGHLRQKLDLYFPQVTPAQQD